MTFDDLGLSDAVRGAVKQAGYSIPTPIQAQAIPHILERRDVLGIAQTGTGQDGSLHAADAHDAGDGPCKGTHAAHAHRGADA